MNDNTFAVYKLLKKADGGYVSGEEIGRFLNISRVAVAKHIKKLAEEGFSIEPAPHEGYRLVTAGCFYNDITLHDAFEAAGLTVPITFLPEIESTNLLAKNAEGSEGLIVALTQTDGRGRKGRAFSSGRGGIYMSYFTHPKNLTPQDALMSVLAAGVALSQALEDQKIPSGLKWTNDVLVDGKKVAGILCEMVSGAESVQRLILGFGINIVNKLPEELKSSAAAIKELGYSVNSNRLAADVVRRIKSYIEDIANGRKEELKREYLKRSLTVGKSVKVYFDNGEISDGTAEGIDENGFLLVKFADGVKRILGADVSIR